MRLNDLFEAKVSTAKQGAAMSTIQSYLEKHLGKMRKLGVEKFHNSQDSGIGQRFVIDGTVECVRFNWVGGKSSEVVSIDVWTGSTRDPNFHIEAKGASFATLLPALVAILKRPRAGTFKNSEAKEAVTEASLGSKVDFDSHKDWDKALPKGCDVTFSADKKVEKAQGRSKDFEGVVGQFDHSKNKGWIHSHYLDKKNLTEAKKGEYTARSAINDMIEKLEAGRSFNRSEFVMNYHPENAHAYDDWVEKNKDKLVVSGKRISLPKGTKMGGASGGDDSGSSSGSSAGSLEVSKGGRDETYDVDVPDEGKVSYNDSLQHLEGLTQGLIKGSFNALFVAGKGGTGKTQTVEDVLSSNGLSDGKGYFKITGSASPIGIYTALYKYKDDIIMFDDCDGALESQDGRNIIKAATDTKKTRKIAWSKKSAGMYDPSEEKSEPVKDDADHEGEEGDEEDEKGDDRIPTYFTFTGQVIFISNLPLNKLDPDGALRTRAFIISIDPTPDEILQRMTEIVGSIKLENGLHLTDKQRMEVLNVIKASKRRNQASLRTLVRALGLAASGAPNWQQLVTLYA